MEPDNALPCSQEPTTSPYPKTDEPSSHTPSYFFNMHFDTIISSQSR
jgi:hypothetical protein